MKHGKEADVWFGQGGRGIFHFKDKKEENLGKTSDKSTDLEQRDRVERI